MVGRWLGFFVIISSVILLLLSSLVISARVMTTWVKENPIAMRLWLHEWAGIDIHYEKATFKTQFNHWVLQLENANIQMEAGTLSVDYLDLNLSWFPNFLGTEFSSANLQGVQLRLHNENEPQTAPDIQALAALYSRWDTFFDLLSDWKWVHIDDVAVFSHDKSWALNIPKIYYEDLISPDLEFVFSFHNKQGDEVKSVDFSAKKTHQNRWVFLGEIPAVRIGPQFSLEHITVNGEFSELQQQAILFMDGGKVQYGSHTQPIQAMLELDGNVASIQNARIGDAYFRGVTVHYDFETIKVALQPQELEGLDTLLHHVGLVDATHNVSGRMNALGIEWNFAQQQFSGLYLKAEDIRLSTKNGQPVVGPLTMEWEHGLDKGKWSLTGSQVQLHIPGVYKELRVIPEMLISGEIDGLLVELDAAHIEKSEVITDLGTAVELEGMISQMASSPTIDVEVRINRMSVEEAKKWMPDQIMNASAYNWIHQNLIVGTVQDFSFRVKGTPESIATESHPDHHLEVALELTGAQMTPLLNWHKIGFQSGKLRYFKNQLGIHIPQARTQRINLSSMHISLDNRILPSRLKIHGLLDADAEAAQTYIEKGPLASTLGIEELVKNSTLTAGNIHMELVMDVRLDDDDPQKTIVNGHMDWEKANYHIYEQPLQRIDGRLTFIDSNVYAQEVKGFWLDQPFVLDIFPQEVRTDASTSQRMVVQGFFDWNPSQWIPQVSGTSSISIRFDIPQQGGVVDLTVQGGMQGITSFLPIPLNKARNDILQLSVYAQMSSRATVVRGDIHNLVHWNIYKDAVEDNKTWVQVSLGQATFPDKPIAGSMQVAVDLPLVSVNRWQGFYDALKKHAAFKGEGVSWLPSRSLVDISANKLRYANHGFNAAKVQAVYIKGGSWDAQVSSEELVGRIVSSENGSLLDVQLDKFSIKQQNTNCANPSPEWEKFSLSIKDFVRDGERIGSLNALMHRNADNIDIHQLEITNGETKLLAKGEYSLTRAVAQFDFNAKGKRLLDVASLVELDLKAFQAEKVEVMGNLKWSGSLYCTNAKKIEGNIVAKSDKGVVKNASPGLGRLLGLLNMRSLVRRLNLDLSDVIAPGLSFDTAEISMRFTNGKMFFDKIDIVAPAADISMEGQSDSNLRVHDFRALVTPRYSDSLVSLYALLGVTSLPVGITALAAGELFNLSGGSEALTEVYLVKGSWDKPNIKAE